MRWQLATAGAAALLGSARAQSDSVPFKDPETGFTFDSFTLEEGLTYRVAVPDTATATEPFDVVYQVIAPKTIGWAGFAWGGSMTYNPLAIIWPNGDDIVLSSRMAYGYYTPPIYPNTTYTVLKKATHVNATHLQLTAKCTGCTRWGDDDFGYTELDPKAQLMLAFAFSNVPVDSPAKPDSTFGIHDLIGHWVGDLSQGANPDFDALVAKNSEGTGNNGGGGEGGATGPSTTLTTPGTTAAAAEPTTTAVGGSSSVPATTAAETSAGSTTAAAEPTETACPAKKPKKAKRHA